MYAHCCVELGITVCESNRCFEIGRAFAGADRYHSSDPGVAGAADHVFTV